MKRKEVQAFIHDGRDLMGRRGGGGMIIVDTF